ncbi:MAG: hypothetical protein GWN71_10550, partial [Gammaproteobacteria bacterium]|nr:hypothetical protein [Gemmatimonadota bacterium]NIU74002.1 hypothetical protein [Gammaproteobacteria bacterium]
VVRIFIQLVDVYDPAPGPVKRLLVQPDSVDIKSGTDTIQWIAVDGGT